MYNQVYLRQQHIYMHKLHNTKGLPARYVCPLDPRSNQNPPYLKLRKKMTTVKCVIVTSCLPAFGACILRTCIFGVVGKRVIARHSYSPVIL